MSTTNKNPNAIFRRQIEAKKRTEAFNKLSPEEKLAELDARLGVDVGARRQRGKLMTEILKNAMDKNGILKSGTLVTLVGRAIRT